MKRIMGLFIIICFLSFMGCDQANQTSDSGVEKATVKVKTDLTGHTVEQNNIIKRYEKDNTAGSIKYLYIISTYSGDVLIYSTVMGKVTSSGKRLTPKTVNDGSGLTGYTNNEVIINSCKYLTSEVIEDDGTYGSSVEYLYWFDSKGIYHQQYISGGCLVHISDQPLLINKPIINMELTMVTDTTNTN